MDFEKSLKRALVGVFAAASVGCATMRQQWVDAESFLPPSGKICASPDQIRNPQLPVHDYLRRIYLKASSPQTEEAALARDMPTICLDRSLNQENERGFFRNGFMNGEGSELLLNPVEERVSYPRRVAITHHEKHHYEQGKSGVSQFIGGNVSAEERL
ncbi:MAG TPA: hypothetical protein VIF12_05905, partial [Micavibrio sp.]